MITSFSLPVMVTRPRLIKARSPVMNQPSSVKLLIQIRPLKVPLHYRGSTHLQTSDNSFADNQAFWVNDSHGNAWNRRPHFHERVFVGGNIQ